MAGTFRPVNGEVTRDNTTSMAVSPTTPTPTKATFGQRPLPTSPFPQAVQIPESIEEATPHRENSQHPKKPRGDSEDVDMDESDGEGHGEDGAGSDDDSVDADGTKSSKKKKSQKFYCTDYPPCTLSFTRSEHLARHIRKHTGERPFQCHCSRRFSRLDNLRQHAQTVHVNEDIPIDSLAATGTRFQRQIRTERVRPSGRARASTAGSMGAASRGHGKSLSTSSISSIGSSFSVRDDARRRPPPLVMATDPRARLSFESHHSAADSQSSYRGPSPSDFSTPTSATFSTVQSSPRWNSTIASPTSAHSRSQSLYAGSRASCRRLSVPSGGNPFQSNVGANLGRSLFVPGSMNTSNPGAYSPVPSSIASPTSTMFSRRESNDESWRRRTWHPDSSNFNSPNTSSRLSNVITPSQFASPSSGSLPIANPATQTTSLRLPGIESFDPIPHRPATPAKQQSSPTSAGPEMSHPPVLLPAIGTTEDRRRSAPQWDLGLHRGLTRLDINSSATPSRDGAGAWAQEVHRAVEAQANLTRLNHPVVRFNDSVTIENRGTSMMGNRAFHQHTMSAPLIPSNTERKRHGPIRVHGAIAMHSDAPPEKMARVERMIHPNISEFSMARQQMTSQQPTRTDTHDRNHMQGLQALAAVATNENAATTAY